MKCIQWFVSCTALSALASPASAQFVKGNEAVQVRMGHPRVETAPVPAAGTSKPCEATRGCHAGPWLMVETAEGLQECTEVYARLGTCRASTYGTQRISRLWVVKAGGKWLQCQYPDLGSKCVEVFARPPANLPYHAVQ